MIVFSLLIAFTAAKDYADTYDTSETVNGGPPPNFGPWDAYGPPLPAGGGLKSYKLLEFPQNGGGLWGPEIQQVPIPIPFPAGPGFGWPLSPHFQQIPQIIPLPGWGWPPGFPFHR